MTIRKPNQLPNSLTAGVQDSLEDLVSSPYDEDTDNASFKVIKEVPILLDMSFLTPALERTTALQQALCWEAIAAVTTDNPAPVSQTIMSSMRMINKSSSQSMLRGFTHLNINLSSWPLAGGTSERICFLHSLSRKLQNANARPSHLTITSNAHSTTEMDAAEADCRLLTDVLAALVGVMGSVHHLTIKTNLLSTIEKAAEFCNNLTNLNLGSIPSSTQMWGMLPPKLRKLRCALSEGPSSNAQPIPSLEMITDTSESLPGVELVCAVLRITPKLEHFHVDSSQLYVLCRIDTAMSPQACKTLLTNLDARVDGGLCLARDDGDECGIGIRFERVLAPVDEMEPALRNLCTPYLQSLALTPIKMRSRFELICHNGHESTRYISEAFPNLTYLRLSAVHTTADDLRHLKHCATLEALRLDACHGIVYEEVKPLLLALIQKREVMMIAAVGCADFNYWNGRDLILLSGKPPSTIRFVVDEERLLSKDS